MELKQAMARIGMASQCMIHPKLAKGKRSYASLLALKVNLKLQGVNLSLHSKELLGENTLILGFDVYHPPVGSSEDSVCALVGNAMGSRGMSYSYYEGQFRRVKSRKELGTLSEDMLTPFTKKWERVLFYRDGVGAQSIDHVKDKEIPIIRAAFKDVPLCVVLMTKRHRHRMFTQERNNVDAGVVVMGDDINLPKQSFLLNSHNGVLGTSHASNYVVLENGVKEWSMEDLAKISFDLAHLHGRATKAVSMPVPMYQAHLLAYFGRMLPKQENLPSGMFWN